MKVHNGFSDLDIKNAVVTTGSFDGVHVGHKVIISRLIQKAKELNGESVLISFFPHPRKVLFPNSEGKNLRMINSQTEKIRLLEKLGLDHLIIVNFTIEFSQTSSINFIRKYLIDQLHVKHVIIGFNHHFGHKREGDLEYLIELGKFYNFSVEEIPEQDIHNESVSSTKIRKALLNGNIQRANAYLDHPYVLSGEVQMLGEISGVLMYSVNYHESEKLFPPQGGYAVSCQNYENRAKAALWVFDQSNDSLIIRFAATDDQVFVDGQKICMHFHKRISDLETISELDAGSINKDLQEVSELIY